MFERLERDEATDHSSILKAGVFNGSPKILLISLGADRHLSLSVSVVRTRAAFVQRTSLGRTAGV